MKFIVKESKEEVAVAAADLVEKVIRRDPACVLGLATGSSPVGMYQELARRCKDGDLDFSAVTTVNLDEYIGLNAEHDQSYHYFMKENFFSHINIDMEKTHVPEGDAEDAEEEAQRYEKLLKSLEPCAVQLLGIGINGHIGFNEPGDDFKLETHVTSLTKETITSNARFFDSIEEVPNLAITMGMGSILRARRIILIALGESKQAAVKALEDALITPKVPATILKVHPDLTVICDREAAGLLDRKNIISDPS